MLSSVIKQVQGGLKILKINLGYLCDLQNRSSTKVFSSQIPNNLRSNTLKSLIFRIGKNNNF